MPAATVRPRVGRWLVGFLGIADTMGAAIGRIRAASGRSWSDWSSWPSPCLLTPTNRRRSVDNMNTTTLSPAEHLCRLLDELDITVLLVGDTDNVGQPCNYCAELDAINVATVYGFDQDAEGYATHDCCLTCVPTVVDQILAHDQPIRIEVAA